MKNFKEELKARGLTLRKFASNVGFSSTYVSEILSGIKQAPKETEDKIIEALEVCPWCERKWPHPLPKVIEK